MFGLVRRAPRFGALALAALVVALGAAPVAAQQPPPQLPQSVSELTRLRDDVYAFRFLNHVALFVPTDDGVVLVDPIGGGGNPKAPVALKAAIAAVSDKPVTHVIYSHAAADHSTGGAVFADTATFIAQANAKPTMEAKNDPTSPPPTVTFETMMPLHVGGKHFELHATALTPQDDYLTFWYPAQKVLMTVDYGRVRTIGFGMLPAAGPDKMIEHFAKLADMFDFEMYLSGHGPAANIHGTRQDLADHRQYYIDLVAGVKDAQMAGLAPGSEEMVAAVRTALQPKYGTWTNFQNGLAGNITGVLRSMGM